MQPNAAQLEAMRAGRLHFIGFNSGSASLAVNVCGFAPFATTFPTTAYGHVHRLHPDLAKNVPEAFFTFDWEGSGLAQ